MLHRGKAHEPLNTIEGALGGCAALNPETDHWFIGTIRAQFQRWRWRETQRREDRVNFRRHHTSHSKRTSPEGWRAAKTPHSNIGDSYDTYLDESNVLRVVPKAPAADDQVVLANDAASAAAYAAGG